MIGYILFLFHEVSFDLLLFLRDDNNAFDEKVMLFSKTDKLYDLINVKDNNNKLLLYYYYYNIL